MGFSRCLLRTLVLAGFLLGICKGYVALWKDGNPEPVQIFPCPVSSLPESRQQELENGVHARSRPELELMMKLYLS